MERRLAAIMAIDVVGYTRLMAEDELGTLEGLKTIRAELVEPAVVSHKGRFIKIMGDGALLDFSSAIEAVACGLEVQRRLSRRNAETDSIPDIRLRLAIHLGDVIIEGRDVYGDGVNVAARLESIAPPGSVCISDDLRRIVEGKIAARVEDFGVHRLKNLNRPVQAFLVSSADSDHAFGEAQAPDLKSVSVRYCRARDGVDIAYAVAGEGPPLVKAATFLTHLEYDRESPVWRHWFTELSKGYRYVRYDQRGSGLSETDVADISFDAFVSDLETVADTLQLERFPILGTSQGCAVAIAYAVRHPERVSSLILCGGYASGWRKREDQRWAERREAMLELIRVGWDQENPAFRQVYTSLFVPHGTQEQHRWFNQLQKMTTTPKNAYRILSTFAEIDVRYLLEKVSQPTLVLHCRGDAVVPISSGREFATSIPNATFVELEGDNHIILQEDPCWPRFLSEVRTFLAQHAT